ncbi:UNVERIFIED_CONTAM: hypothetical protein K2H54_077906 [Gekko kuhli]
MPNWFCAAFALLLLCALLLAMVAVMSVKVQDLEQTSAEQMEAIKLNILVLSETLKQLQMGKVWTCAMCRIYWVQRANTCFWFSDLSMSWESSEDFCDGESSTLAVVETKAELEFLRHESSKYFTLNRGKKNFDRFWIGSKYVNFTGLRLGDGTVIPIRL